MNYLGKVLSNWKFIYSEINAATLTGAIDVVVVEQPDGTYTCSPFHVRFGKIGVLRSKEKIVDIEINGEPVDIHMKLGESGEAFFVEEVVEGVPPHLATSPIPPFEEFAPRSALTPDDDDDDDDDEEGESGGEVLTRCKGGCDEISINEIVGSGNEVINDGGELRKEFNIDQSSFSPAIGVNSDLIRERLNLTKEDSQSGDEVPDDASGIISSSSKRKRRRKSMKKKKGGIMISSSTSLTREATIFQMEDVDTPHANLNEEQVLLIKDEAQVESPITPPTSMERDIHFFSDTEITPGSSPREERDFAPVQSDSEFETSKRGESSERVVVGEDQRQSWKWGELPSTEPIIQDKKQESQKWMIQNMLGFMKKTKHMRHKSDNEGGIYLSELNSEDPEMAALYFPNHYRASVSNNSQEFHPLEEDAESGNGPSLSQSPHSVEGAVCSVTPSKYCYPEDVALSTCGLESPETFDENLVRYEDLVTYPSLSQNPKLVIRIEGKIYPWQKAVPLVISLFVFQKPLPQDLVTRLLENEIEPQMEKEKSSRRVYYSSWFNWSRMNQQKMGEEAGKATVLDIDPEKIENATEVTEPLDLSKKSIELSAEILGEMATGEQNSVLHRKSLRLSSQQIAKLKLRPGSNEVEFSVTTAYQGTSRCKCFLFCWRYDDKIVVSDIDGTITKSDVLGHILPIVGKDWAQSGVAKLFTKIKENGYKLLYLSARAIGQSRVTREYLKSIKQEDLTLPEGPMLLNPTSLLNAFHTEVIEKKPEEFKISCLRDIQALFPLHIKPFYAGYGNKINDVWAYQAVGIPIFRIFTINHRGELKHELTQTFQSTYSNMSGLVDQMFPPSKPLSSEDFSEFAYWREPILDLESFPDFSSQIKK